MNIDLDDFFLVRYASKVLIGVVLFLFLTMYSGCSELRYMAMGNEITADVISVKEGMEGGKRKYPVVLIEYVAVDDSGYRVYGTDGLSPDQWEMVEAKKINVTYIKDNPILNTFTIKRTKFWVWMMAVMVVVAAVAVWLALQQAQRDVAKSKRRG